MRSDKLPIFLHRNLSTSYKKEAPSTGGCRLGLPSLLPQLMLRGWAAGYGGRACRVQFDPATQA
jgi:hypothetical protein